MLVSGPSEMGPNDRPRRPNAARSNPGALQRGASGDHFGDLGRKSGTLQKPYYLLRTGDRAGEAHKAYRISHGESW